MPLFSIPLEAFSSCPGRIETDASFLENHDWPIWGGSPENSHYSPLAQINRANVKQLEVAWSFDTGEPGGLQTSPIIVDGVLYGITPTQKVFALNAATGKPLWSFDSGIKGLQPNRGLAYWAHRSDKRILVSVMNFLYALNADSGRPIPSFGTSGWIDLQENLGRDPRWQSVVLTSPELSIRTSSSLEAVIPRRCPRRRATFEPTTCVPEGCAGHFTPFRTPVSLVTTHGQRRLESKWSR